MTVDEPRDLIGYGPAPPFADWPGGARLALNFVINFEEGSEAGEPDHGWHAREIHRLVFPGPAFDEFLDPIHW